MKHQKIELRSIAFHRLVAERLLQNPSLLDVARENLRRWNDKGGRSSPYFAQWKEILDLPPEKVAEIIVSEEPQMVELRQSTPFCGILSPRERWQVYEAFRA